jgi:hypothetical protein
MGGRREAHLQSGLAATQPFASHDHLLYPLLLTGKETSFPEARATMARWVCSALCTRGCHGTSSGTSALARYKLLGARQQQDCNAELKGRQERYTQERSDA